MSDNQPHYAIRFASRYTEVTHPYLTAQVALGRLVELIEESEKLGKTLDAAEPVETRWEPWVGSEVVSYFSVGFVTCLEWHARSRLADLLSHFPAAARSTDLKVIKDKVVLEMLSANVSIASVVAAATNISTFDDYMDVFQRVFEAMNGTEAFEVVRGKKGAVDEAYLQPAELEEIQTLYKFRNNLVHEIGIHRVGHWLVRDRWNAADAVKIGNTVQKLMRLLEGEITRVGSPTFPNLIGPDGYATGEIKVLEDQILALEQRLEAFLNDFGEALPEGFTTIGEANLAAREYLTVQSRFVDDCPALFNRYVEMRMPARVSLLKSRREHLRQVIDIIGQVWGMGDE